MAGGIYTGVGDQVVLLDKSVTVSGGWDGAFAVQNGTTIVDGERARRGVVVIYADVTAVLERFTIKNGSGGGVANYGTLTLSHSTIRDNVAEIGGGGLYNQGTAILNDSAVIANSTTATPTMGMGGGGIYNTTAKLTLNNCTVSGNTTAARGGGILSLWRFVLEQQYDQRKFGTE